MPILAVIGALLARLAALGLRFIGPMLVQLALTFGVSMVTYHLGVGPFVALISTALGGVGAMVLGVLGGLNMDKAVTIILSAHLVRYASRVVFRRGT
jgi:hypothetical protein